MNLKPFMAFVVLAAASSAAAQVVIAPIRGSVPVLAAAGAAVSAPLSVSAAPSLSAAALSAPSLSAALAAPSLPVHLPGAVAPGAAVPAPALVPAASPAAPRAIDSAKSLAAPVPGGASASQARAASVRQFDGGPAASPAGEDGPAYSAPDNSAEWYDRHTGEYETQTTKIKKAYQLALSHPLAAAIKNGLTRNTVYRVDNSPGDWHLHTAVRTQGDDPEKAEADALVVFNHNALQQLSPEFLAAKLASMWVRHLYRDTLPASAEKTYVEGSVLVRVFMGLTGSTAQNWNGAKDYYIGGTFELYRHFYHWIQGFRFANVRQGPYFLNKIMRAEGDPSIDADARGRMTLFQRAQAGQIDAAQAEAAQHRFDGFVANERR